MMLGYTDPSSHQAWAYPYRTGERGFISTDSPGVNVQAVIGERGAAVTTVKTRVVRGRRVKVASTSPGAVRYRLEELLSYTWPGWDQPTYHERKKQGFEILKSFFHEP